MDSRKIDRLIQIKGEIETLRREQADLEADFLLQANQDLQDTKYKTTEYVSGTGNKVVASTARTVKLAYPSYLRRIFGDAYKDAVTESTTYKLSAPAARMLGGLWSSEYIQTTLPEAIAQIPCDDATRQTLAKKLHGVNYDNDVRVLQTVAKLPRDQAQEWAWYVAEAAVWDDFRRLLQANGLVGQEDMQYILSLVQGAVVVEEAAKIAAVPISKDK